MQINAQSGRGILTQRKVTAKVPPRVHLYTLEGLGKTTFGAEAPRPIFICAEGGTRYVDVDPPILPTSFQDVMDGVQELIVQPHDYRTLVIDTLDWIEPMIWDVVVAEWNGTTKGKKDEAENIEEVGGGFMKGYGPGFALDVWRGLLVKLEELNIRRSMGVILLSHAVVRTQKNPEGADYGTYSPAIERRAAALVNQWSDATLFGSYAETFVVDKLSGTKKTGAFVMGGSNRIIHTDRKAAFIAKNRLGLPPEIPLRYAAFEAACHAAPKQDANAVRAAIRKFYKKLPAEMSAKIEPAVAAEGSMPNLYVLLARTERIVADADVAVIQDLLEQLMDATVTGETTEKLTESGYNAQEDRAHTSADLGAIESIKNGLRERLNILRATGETA